ncbi:MAG: signal peptidase I [Ruminococcus sp.]|uniref:signal peptidase I n=1 Tax=Ruminococcus sp. TaxID=41978 RepID=UPI0025EA0C90|nr:signal peptidase I [Ruminococcus sp.]MCR5599440.1 signal peptidase I [Ruminococcus sp.]
MKKALKTVVNILVWIVLIFALLITIVVFSSGNNNGVANLFGYIPMTVESDSMKPTFVKDDLIICKEVDDMNSLKENDVITFWTVINGKRAKNTHRIVSVNGEGSSRSFITRGDNNAIDDTTPVSASDVIGKWTNKKIGGFGKIMSFLRTKKGFFICIVIPMALFFLFELYKFIVVLVEAKRPEPVEQLDEEEIKRRAIEEYLASKGESAENAAAKASEAVGKTAEKTEDTAEKAAENFEEAKKEAFEKFEAVKQEAERVEKNAADDANNTEEKAAENAETVAEAVEEKAAENVVEKVEDTAEVTAKADEENNLKPNAEIVEKAI